MRTLATLSTTLAAALLLGGCAALNDLNNEVSTYGEWPAGRQPSTYAFERLPSQQAQPQRQQMLEDAARGAVEAAGFKPAADAAGAEYVMQLGARVSVNDPWYDADPLWWRGGMPWPRPYYYRGRFGPRFWGPAWGPSYPYYWGDTASFEREVAVLIRDGRTGQILYEARASNVGASAGIDSLLPAMFEAALKDFPKSGPNPRTVTVPISRKS
jgi:hypothetical protein